MTAENTSFDFSTLPDRDIVKAAQSSTPVMDTVSSNRVDPTICNRILNDIHRESGSDNHTNTYVAVCGLLQKGGTSRAMNNSSSFTHGNTRVTKAILHNACNRHNATPRQLARTLADRIADISLALSLPGNQSKNYRLRYPNAAPNELAWASDFQTFNPNCPNAVRDFLVENYVTRFRNN